MVAHGTHGWLQLLGVCMTEKGSSSFIAGRDCVLPLIINSNLGRDLNSYL